MDFRVGNILQKLGVVSQPVDVLWAQVHEFLSGQKVMKIDL